MAGFAASRVAAGPSGPFRFETARREDDAAIRRLLRDQPLGGRVRLALTREPSVWLAAEVEGERHHTVVARDDDGRVVGVGSRSVRRLWLGGKPERVGYLGQLRRSSERARNMRLLARGFTELERGRCAGETSFDLTSIIADNAPARRLLERGLPGFPRYQPIGGLTTLMLEVPRRLRPRAGIVGGSDARIPEAVEFLENVLSRHAFAPVWTEQMLRSRSRSLGLAPEDFLLLQEGHRIVGCCAVWDQRPFKQVVVRGYDGVLGRLRSVVNFGRRVARRPTLPPAERQLALGYLSHFAVTGSWADAVRLVDAAMTRARQKQLDYLVLGLPREDPWVGALKRRYHAHTYVSTLYVVHRPGDTTWMPALDGAPPRVDVATL